MAETLRELVVALSLDSGSFSRNLKTINLQIKEAESEFKLAGAGIENFANTADGSAAKLGLLGEKLNAQKLTTNEYSKRLDELQKHLRTVQNRHTDYSNRLKNAQRVHERLGTEVEKAAAQYEKYASELGETDSATIAAQQNLEALKEEYKASGEEVKKLEGQVAAFQKNIRDTNDNITRANTGLNNANAEMRETQAEIAKTNRKLLEQQSAWYTAANSIEEYGKKASKNNQVWIDAGEAMTAGLTAPIIALGAASLKSAIEYESAFASVRKTVDATDVEYTALSSDIQRMSTELAMSADEIAELVAIAGQLGIEKDSLIDFTRTMVDLGNSTNVSAEDAATSLARFANITGMSEGKWSNLGSAIVDLGNNFATTESEIIDMAYRLAAAGKQVGMTEAEILAIAASLSSVGIEAQMGGTAFSKALVKMEVAAETGGEALTDFATVSQMTEEQFATLWDADPTKAFMAFVEGLASMDEEGQSAIVTLQDIGIEEVRLRDTLLRTVNANELFNEALETSNAAWDENVALSNEAGKRYATTASKLTNLKNKGVQFARTYGNDMNPVLHSVIDSTNELLDKYLEMDETQRRTIAEFATVAASIGPALLAYGKIKKAFEPLTKNAAALIKYIGGIGVAAKEAGGGIGGLWTAVSSKPGAMIALTAAVVAGAVALYDYASGAKAAREALEEMDQMATDWKNTAAETFYNRQGAGLANLGMDENAFRAQVASTKGWLDRLVAEWNDNEKETDETVSAWVESYKKLNADVRSELDELNQTAVESGRTEYSAQIQEDMARLDSYDAEVEKLLNKRKRRNLTEKEQIKLNELIDARDALVVKYELRPADGQGFDEIRNQLENTLAYAEATGDAKLEAQAYEDAVVAAAQGMQVINSELNTQYGKERDLIKLMEDGEEKEAALAALDKKYATDRKKATEEYGRLLNEVYGSVYKQEGMQETAEDLDSLLGLLTQYAQMGEEDQKGMLRSITDAMAGLDEGQLAEYLALIEQIKALETEGIDVSAMFPELDFDATEKLAQIQQYLKDYEELPGLSEGIEAVVEEALTIAVNLDMEEAKATWEAFAADPGSLISSNLKLAGYDAISYKNFIAANEKNPVPIKGVLNTQSMTAEELEAALFGEDTVYTQNGVQIEFSGYVESKLSKNDFLLFEDESGKMYVEIVPRVTGTQEAVTQAQDELEKEGGIDVTSIGLASGIQSMDWKSIVDNAASKIEDATRERSLWEKIWNPPANTESILTYDIEPMQDELATYLAELAQYKASGNALTEQQAAEVESIISLLEAMDTADVGKNIIAGVVTAMNETDLSEDAKLTKDNLIEALNKAFDIHSPAGAMELTGGYIAAGVGKGMSEYAIEDDAAALKERLMQAMAGYDEIGLGVMGALASGITAGRNAAVYAMRNAASAIVEEASAQFALLAADIVRNANVSLGYIGSGGQSITRNNTKNTYNQQSTTNVTGNTFVLNDTASIRQLKKELAIDNAKVSKGYGLA